MVKKKVVIDTNVVIDHLRVARLEKSLFETCIEDPEMDPLMSATTIQELFVGQSSLRALSTNSI